LALEPLQPLLRLVQLSARRANQQHLVPLHSQAHLSARQAQGLVHRQLQRLDLQLNPHLLLALLLRQELHLVLYNLPPHLALPLRLVPPLGRFNLLRPLAPLLRQGPLLEQFNQQQRLDPLLKQEPHLVPYNRQVLLAPLPKQGPPLVPQHLAATLQGK